MHYSVISGQNDKATLWLQEIPAATHKGLDGSGLQVSRLLNMRRASLMRLLLASPQMPQRQRKPAELSLQ
jgi:hypothetical protein